MDLRHAGARGIDPKSCGPQALLTRNVTSAYIWAQITGSEWTLAPIMRPPDAVTSWAQRSGPTSQGMRCLANRWRPRATLLADAADALAQALSEPEQATWNQAGPARRGPRKVQTAPPTAPNRTR